LTLAWTPATELARRIQIRELSPVELLDDVLARVEAHDGQIHSFLTLDAERARDAARQAESAPAAGLLHGLPVSIKDLEPTAGLRTTYGSKFFEQNVPDLDGAVTTRVKAAGGIVFGKTNTPNYGHKDMCDNLLGPACRNPWDTTRTSGASSGGAAAAAAAGFGPLHHGSDGAGSIRIPACLCGVFGLKPSYGRVAYWPNNDFWATRSHNGPITRTVRDAALMLSAIAGPDPLDPYTIDQPPIDYVAACDGDLKGLRVAWSADFGYARVEPEVRRIAEAAARRFEELGAHVEEAVPGWDDPAPCARIAWYASMLARHGERFRQRPEWFEPSMTAQIEGAMAYTGQDVYGASLTRSDFYNRATAFMQRFDLLLTPQMPRTAWRWDEPAPLVDGVPCPDIFDRLPFTFPFNLTGWPAATVPCGFDAEGLPVGLQIVGNWHQDALVLRAAAAFEALQPWAANRPSSVSAP
jgi:Asp-tRNA(Asn)/Glu-tRNA(Gln) amidotransferase A subunit family amidase